MVGGLLTLLVEQGALLSVPVWESRQEGRNWFARIALDPQARGGVDRHFFRRAGAGYYYLLEGLEVADPVEFGADWVPGPYQRVRLRWYGVVWSLSGAMLQLVRSPDAKTAVAASIARRAKQVEVKVRPPRVIQMEGE